MTGRATSNRVRGRWNPRLVVLCLFGAWMMLSVLIAGYSTVAALAYLGGGAALIAAGGILQLLCPVEKCDE
jgi:predicted phage tail protein